MVESALEEILLEYPNDPVVDKLKGKWKSFRTRDSSIESGKINNR